MKNWYALTIILFFTGTVTSLAQEVKPNRSSYQQIESKLAEWDNVRGPWLSEAIQKVEGGQPVSTRPFPEPFTPNQMMQKVPQSTRSEMLRIANDARKNGEDLAFWNTVSRYVSSSNCQYVRGRTYGDPHLVSFDGARNSFQTVGEFVLTKSNQGDMEVQVRQRPQSNDFSLNTAVAMNVAGDRVCIYASDYPDGDYSTPVRLEGRSLNVGASTHMLPHGGTIKKFNNQYTVYWPSGESVTTEVRNSRSMSFINVTVNVSECNSGNYNGLLGNANGTQRDDYATAGVAPVGVWDNDDYFDRKRQEYMAKDFAELHRISQEASLFDYMIGKNTLTYTDRSYPRVYRDFNDLNSRQLSRARKHCNQQGVDPRDMQGCVYDQAYLGIEGRPAPVTPDPVVGTVLRPVQPKPVNPPTDPSIELDGKKDKVDGGMPAERSDESGKLGNGREENTRPTAPRVEPSKPRAEPSKPRVEPSWPRTEPARPKPSPRPTPPSRTTPRSTPKPTPQPKTMPRPTGRLGGR